MSSHRTDPSIATNTTSSDVCDLLSTAAPGEHDDLYWSSACVFFNIMTSPSMMGSRETCALITGNVANARAVKDVNTSALTYSSEIGYDESFIFLHFGAGEQPKGLTRRLWSPPES